MSGSGIKRVETDSNGLQMRGSGWERMRVSESKWEWMGVGRSGWEWVGARFNIIQFEFSEVSEVGGWVKKKTSNDILHDNVNMDAWT